MEPIIPDKLIFIVLLLPCLLNSRAPSEMTKFFLMEQVLRRTVFVFLLIVVCILAGNSILYLEGKRLLSSYSV